jgi:hypothetical protein
MTEKVTEWFSLFQPTKLSEQSGNVLFEGWAKKGSNTSDSVWQIKRTVFSNTRIEEWAGEADKQATHSFVWDLKESYFTPPASGGDSQATCASKPCGSSLFFDGTATNTVHFHPGTLGQKVTRFFVYADSINTQDVSVSVDDVNFFAIEPGGTLNWETGSSDNIQRIAVSGDGNYRGMMVVS